MNEFDKFFTEQPLTAVSQRLASNDDLDANSLSQLYLYIANNKHSASPWKRLKLLQFIISFFYDPWHRQDTDWYSDALSGSDEDKLDSIYLMQKFTQRTSDGNTININNVERDLVSTDFDRTDYALLLDPEEDKLQKTLTHIEKGLIASQHLIVKVPYAAGKVVTLNISKDENNKIRFLLLAEDPDQKDHKIHFESKIFDNLEQLQNHLSSRHYGYLFDQKQYPIIIESFKIRKSFIARIFFFIVSFFHKKEKFCLDDTHSSEKDFTLHEGPIAPTLLTGWYSESAFDKGTSSEKLLYNAAIENDSTLFFKLFDPTKKYPEGFLETVIIHAHTLFPNSAISKKLLERQDLDKDLVVEGLNKSPSTSKISIRELEILNQLSQKGFFAKRKVQLNPNDSNAVIYRKQKLNKQLKSKYRSQNLIRIKGNVFLKSQQAGFQLDPEGSCSGLGFLYGYCKWLTHHMNQYPEQYPDRDDPTKYCNLIWFNKMIDYVINRDSQNYSDAEDKELMLFLTFVCHYSFPDVELYPELKGLSAGVLQKRFEDFFLGSVNESIKQELNLMLRLSSCQFEKVLSDFPENKFIRLSANQHTVTLYKENGRYFYYDANSLIGEKAFDGDQLKELSQQIFSDLNLNSLDYENISFSIYNFNNACFPSFNPMDVKQFNQKLQTYLNLPEAILASFLFMAFDKNYNWSHFYKEYFESKSGNRTYCHNVKGGLWLKLSALEKQTDRERLINEFKLNLDNTILGTNIITTFILTKNSELTTYWLDLYDRDESPFKSFNYINAADPATGVYPLHAAIIANDVNLVKELLARGADPSLECTLTSSGRAVSTEVLAKNIDNEDMYLALGINSPEDIVLEQIDALTILNTKVAITKIEYTIRDFLIEHSELECYFSNIIEKFGKYDSIDDLEKDLQTLTGYLSKSITHSDSSLYSKSPLPNACTKQQQALDYIKQLLDKPEFKRPEALRHNSCLV